MLVSFFFPNTILVGKMLSINSFLQSHDVAINAFTISENALHIQIFININLYIN